MEQNLPSNHNVVLFILFQNDFEVPQIRGVVKLSGDLQSIFNVIKIIRKQNEFFWKINVISLCGPEVEVYDS